MSSTSEPATVSTLTPTPTVVPLAAAGSACALRPGTQRDVSSDYASSSGAAPTKGARRLPAGSFGVGAMFGDWTYLGRPPTTTDPPVVPGPAIGRVSGQELTEIWLGDDDCKATGLVDDDGRLWMGMCPYRDHDGATTTDLYALDGGEVVDHLAVAGYNCLDLVGGVGDQLLLRGFRGPTSIIDQFDFRLIDVGDDTEIVQAIGTLCPGYEAVPVGSTLLYCKSDGAHGSLVDIATAARIDPGAVPSGSLDPQDPRWVFVETQGRAVRSFDVRDRVAGKPDRWNFPIDPGGCDTTLPPTTREATLAVWDARGADTYTIQLLDSATGAPIAHADTAVSSMNDPSSRTGCHLPLATATDEGVWFIGSGGMFLDDTSTWTRD